MISCENATTCHSSDWLSVALPSPLRRVPRLRWTYCRTTTAQLRKS